eukprot:GHVS01024973.1.p1 GENE.GHVS01024973.1~~GHVS01024973.1.p1  ORF type:complete len:493 (+),score=83.47 GHVS01024973.1:112-1590(+)
MEALTSRTTSTENSGATTETTNGKCHLPQSPSLLSPASCPSSPLPDCSTSAPSLPETALSGTACLHADAVKPDLVGIVFRVSIRSSSVVDVGQQEQVAIVGNCGPLGDWSVQNALRLQLWWKTPSPRSYGDRTSLSWVSPTVFLENKAFADMEFKCVILRPLSHVNTTWETFGPNVFENRRLPQGSREGGDDDVRVVRMEFGQKDISVEKIILPGHRCLPAVPSTPASHEKGSPSRRSIMPPFGVGWRQVPCADLVTNCRTVQRNAQREIGGSSKMGRERDAVNPVGGNKDDPRKEEANANNEEDISKEEEGYLGMEDMVAVEVPRTTSGSTLSTLTGRRKEFAKECEGKSEMKRAERNGEEIVDENANHKQEISGRPKAVGGGKEENAKKEDEEGKEESGREHGAAGGTGCTVSTEIQLDWHNKKLSDKHNKKLSDKHNKKLSDKHNKKLSDKQDSPPPPVVSYGCVILAGGLVAIAAQCLSCWLAYFGKA